MPIKLNTPTEQSVESSTESYPVPLSCEVPKYVRDAIENEAAAQKRPSRANMTSVILTEWADARAKQS